ncbi:hypothetical protein FKM82_004336 [Ascaphus truei]
MKINSYSKKLPCLVYVIELSIFILGRQCHLTWSYIILGFAKTLVLFRENACRLAHIFTRFILRLCAEAEVWPFLGKNPQRARIADFGIYNEEFTPKY